MRTKKPTTAIQQEIPGLEIRPQITEITECRPAPQADPLEKLTGE